MAPYGITARMHEHGLQVRRWQIRSRRGGMVAEFDLGLLADVTPYPYRLHLEQHRLTPIQLDILRKEPSAEVHFGHRVTGFEHEARFGAGASSSPRASRASSRHRWLIGADGGRSTIRKLLPVEFEGFTWPEQFLVVSTPYDFGAPRLHHERVRRRPDGMGGGVQDARRRPAGTVAARVSLRSGIARRRAARSGARCRSGCRGFFPASRLRNPLPEHLPRAPARGERMAPRARAARRRRRAPQQPARRLRPEQRHPRRGQPRRQARHGCGAARRARRCSTSTCSSAARRPSTRCRRCRSATSGCSRSAIPQVQKAPHGGAGRRSRPIRSARAQHPARDPR